jgi:hypothetical protein
MSKPFSQPLRRFLLGGLVLAALAGCQEDVIRHYQAPKESTLEPPSKRMLAVMVPRGQDVWFFKFFGPRRAVSEHEADFDSLIRSVKFQDKANEPITWTTPEGWRQQLGGELRYATLRFGPKDEALEITISKLGREAARPRENIDRWRGQIGLPPISDEELRQLTDNLKVDGLPATRIDLVSAGPGAVAGSEKSSLPFQYTRPDGWELLPADAKKGVRRPLVLRVKDGEQAAEVTAVPLPGDGGGLLFNVNRWRGQVGLGPTTEEDLLKDVRRLTVAGEEAPYVDLAGSGANGQRILGVVMRHEGRTWFFTMKGPADFVGKQQSAFEGFIKSIRFGG